MKKYLSLLLIFALTISLAACGSSTTSNTTAQQSQSTTAQSSQSTSTSAEKASVTIKYADFHATSTIHWQGVLKFKELVEKKSGGSILVETYPAGQLGSQAELLESVKSGTIQMTYGNSPLLSNYVPEFAVLDLPYVFSDYAHIKKVVFGDIGKDLNQRLVDATGMRILTWVHSGFRDMLTNNLEIKTLKDFSGVKFRSPESFAYVSMFKALGASPTPLPWNEVYEAVRTKIVDGLETTTEAIVSNKFWEVCKYVIVSHHIYTVETPVINEAFWEKLTDEQKTWITESLQEITTWQNEQIEQNEIGYYETMEKNGMMLIKIDRQPLMKACEAVWTEFTEKNPNAKSFIDRINALK